MKVNEHREEVIRLLTALHERQKTIFERIERIDRHLEKLNGKVAEHENSITTMRTWGSVAVFTIPLIISIIIKVL